MLTRVSMNRFRKLTNQTMRRDHSRKGQRPRHPFPPTSQNTRNPNGFVSAEEYPYPPPPIQAIKQTLELTRILLLSNTSPIIVDKATIHLFLMKMLGYVIVLTEFRQAIHRTIIMYHTITDITHIAGTPYQLEAAEALMSKPTDKKTEATVKKRWAICSPSCLPNVPPLPPTYHA